MTLELSSDELRSLMHTVSLALYVTEPSQDPECAAEMEAMQALADKIFDAGWREGHRDIAQFDASQGLFMLREEYVNDSVYSRTIRDFEDDFFWGNSPMLSPNATSAPARGRSRSIPSSTTTAFRTSRTTTWISSPTMESIISMPSIPSPTNRLTRLRARDPGSPHWPPG